MSPSGRTIKAYIGYKKGFKYQLEEDCTYYSGIEIPVAIDTEWATMTTSGIITLKRGFFCWDGPSGPTWDTPSSMRGSGFHDCGYSFLRHDLIPHGQGFRKQFDNMMYDIFIEDGMWKLRAKNWRRQVGKFAKGAAAIKNVKVVIYAP